MLGSILSNLLLVLGMCFFLGGLTNMTDERGRGSEQIFASGTAQTACSLMTLSTASMVIPATLAMVIERGPNPGSAKESILILSRGTSIILLLLYVLYLYFQLRTHKNLFNPDVPEDEEEGQGQGGSEEDEASMSAWSAAAVLIGVTVVISICADYLVDSIDAIVATGAISKNFIGLILIPIVGNAAEHVTACVVAVRNKMDLAMGVAVGSSVQIALLVTPFLVLLGWAMGKQMDLQFETCKYSPIALHVVTIYLRADTLMQSRPSLFLFPFLWSRTSFRTASPIISRAPCCSAYMSSSRSRFMLHLVMRWMDLAMLFFRCSG